MDGSFNPARRKVLRQIACTPVAASLGSLLWSTQGWANTGASLPDLDPVVHFLRRTSFGIRPADLTAIRASGIDVYLETQLGPAPADDLAHPTAVAGFPIAHLDATAYWRVVFPDARAPATGDFAGHWPAIAAQVVGNALYRALFSKQQLFEVMVQFWSNHLNTYDPTFKGPEQQSVIRAHALGNFRAMVTASQRDTAMSRYLNNGESKKPTPNQNYARELLELHTLGEGRGYGQADVIELAKILSGHSWDMDRKSATFGQYKYRPEWHVDGAKAFLGATIAATGATEINQALDLIFARPECAEFIAFKLCRHFVADTPERISDLRPGDLASRAAIALRNSGYDIKAVLRFILKSPEFAASADQKFARPMESAVGMLRAYDISMAELRPDSFNRSLGEIYLDMPANFDNTLRAIYDRMPRSISGPLQGIYDASPDKLNRTLRDLRVPYGSSNALLSDGIVEQLATYLRNAGNLPGYWPTPDGYPDKGSFWASATQFITRWNYIAEEAERNVGTERLTVMTNSSGDTRASRRVPNAASTARNLVRQIADQLLHRPLRTDHEDAIATYIGDGNPNAALSAASVKYLASAAATILLASPYAQLR